MSRRELLFIILSGLVIFILVFIAVYRLGGGNLNFPKIRQTVTSTPNPVANSVIKVTSPYVNQKVKTPFKITGEAKVFANNFTYRVTDSLGRILGEGQVMAKSQTTGSFAPFEITITSLPDVTGKGQIEVFNYSNSGKVANELKFPVTIE